MFWEEVVGTLMHTGIQDHSQISSLTNLKLIDEHFKLIYNIGCLANRRTWNVDWNHFENWKSPTGKVRWTREHTLAIPLCRHCLLPQHIWKFTEIENFREKGMFLKCTMSLTEGLHHLRSNFWHIFPDNFKKFFIILYFLVVWNELILE